MGLRSSHAFRVRALCSVFSRARRLESNASPRTATMACSQLPKRCVRRAHRGLTDAHACIPRWHAQALSPACAPQGSEPTVRIYQVSNLQCIAVIAPPVSLGYTALALSGDGVQLAVCTDEPDLTITIYDWQRVSDGVRAGRGEGQRTAVPSEPGGPPQQRLPD